MGKTPSAVKAITDVNLLVYQGQTGIWRSRFV